MGPGRSATRLGGVAGIQEVARPVSLGIAIDAARELRIVSLGRRNDEVHVRAELETILVVVPRRENRFGSASILAHQASHIAKPVEPAELVAAVATLSGRTA